MVDSTGSRDGDDARSKARRLTISVAVATGVVALAGLVSFVVATTFFGDDHVFLAFSRYASNPLIAFVRDQHGGEYYRPLPMVLWWVLGRIAGGSSWPFATVAFLLHLIAAIEVGLLSVSFRGDRRTGAIATALFFLAPSTREAAYWYAASTDLLVTVFGLAAVIVFLRRYVWRSALLFGLACWSKESAIVIPILCIVVLRSQEPRIPWRAAAKRALGLTVVAAVYLIARSLVLHGTGGSGDRAAPVGTKLVQIGAGLIQMVTGSDVSETVAWATGCAAWIALLFHVVRSARLHARLPTPWVSLLWISLSLGPVLAAPQIVGARYFYLATAGLAWLAADSLRSRSTVVLVGVLAVLGGLDFSQTIARRTDVASYRQRLDAARRAVVSGLSQGYATFHIASGIKDLDLAVKEDPRVTAYESTLVVTTDVPESFIALPEARAEELDFLLARPPLPPLGAYRFGTRRIVGLARRGDDPGIEEVLVRLPQIRFIRLRLGPGGRVLARDVTEIVRASDGDPP